MPPSVTSSNSRLWFHPCCILAALLLAPRAVGQEPRLLFRVTFDDLTANAQVAQGNPKSSLTRELGLTAREGFNKKTALVLGDGEQCAYEIKGNLELSAGTISFWAKPYNWNDAEGRFKKFFQVFGSEGGVPFGMYIDSPNSPGAARVVMTQGPGGRPGSKLYQFNAPADWKSLRWHKIDVTWDQRHLAIYVNGRLGERKEIDGIRFPKLELGTFSLVPIFHSGDGTFHNGQDRSLIDDFEIYSGPLSADRILQRYMADIGGDVPSPLLVVPRASTAVTIDGRLEEGTWSTASRVPLPINAATMYPHWQWASASICYDNDNLYVGFRSDKSPGPLVAAARERDGKVWEDDAFELFLTPAHESGGRPRNARDFFQFVFNSAAALYDARHGQGSWNGKVSAKTHVADDHWTAEVAIPFSELGTGTPKAGEIWLGNFCRDWARPSPAQPVYTGWAYLQGGFLMEPDKYGRLVFSDSTRGARLDLSPSLNGGMLDLTAACGGPGKLDASVKSESGTPFQQTREFDHQLELRERLKDAKEGLLSIVLKSEGTGDVLSFSMRFMVKEPIDLAWLPDPANKRLGLIADLSNVDPEWLPLVSAGKTTLDVSWVGPSLDRGAASFPVDRPTGTFTIPLGYEAGNYELTCRLKSPEMSRPLDMVKPLEIPALPWTGSRVGMSDQVLEPWTPLDYDGDATVSCWGRSYTFGGPFLQKSVQRGRDLLAGPITMTLTTPAGIGSLISTGSRPLRKDADRAEFAGTANFGPARLDADWTMWTEYDGLTVATVTLKPAPEGSDLRRLVLRIPLRSDLAKYLRGGTHMGMIKTGRIAWDGKRHEDTFQPFLWACTETEGFLYFCESEAGWVNPAGARPVVVQGGPEAFIELTIVGQEVRLTRPQSYTFGFQATPVKPLAKDRRAWNFGMHGPTRHINARNWMTGYAEQDGHWKVPNVAAVRKFDAAQRAEGVKLLYYGCTSCTPDHNPTYNLYEKVWASSFSASYPNRNDATAFRPAWVPYRLAAVCPGDPSFQDFMLYYGDQFLRECGVPGLYTDTDDVCACDNAHHGHRFTDQFGKTVVTYTFLGKRAFAKRLASVVRSFPDERRWWMTHSHAKLVPPVHGFADFWLPGEENTYQLRGNKWWYIDTLDDVAWRVEYADHSSGLVHMFLPEFMRGTSDATDLESPQPSESLLAMCAVTDVNTTGGFMNRDAMGDWWGLRKRLDLIDAEFTGYWEADCPIKTATPKALASLYKTPAGSFVVPVTNRQPEATDVTVTVDLKALGLEGKMPRAVDERTGKPLEITQGTFTVPVQGRNYTMVSLRVR